MGRCDVLEKNVLGVISILEDVDLMLQKKQDIIQPEQSEIGKVPELNRSSSLVKETTTTTERVITNSLV